MFFNSIWIQIYSFKKSKRNFSDLIPRFACKKWKVPKKRKKKKKTSRWRMRRKKKKLEYLGWLNFGVQKCTGTVNFRHGFQKPKIRATGLIKGSNRQVCPSSLLIDFYVITLISMAYLIKAGQLSRRYISVQKAIRRPLLAHLAVCRGWSANCNARLSKKFNSAGEPTKNAIEKTPTMTIILLIVPSI